MKNLYYYNRNLFIDNLKKVLDDRKMRPQDLVKLGISQPRISECLNKTKKANFTFEQVVLISHYLNVSIDSLVGMETNRLDDNITLHDIMKLLFIIDEVEPFSIEQSDGSLPVQ